MTSKTRVIFMVTFTVMLIILVTVFYRSGGIYPTEASYITEAVFHSLAIATAVTVSVWHRGGRELLIVFGILLGSLLVWGSYAVSRGLYRGSAGFEAFIYPALEIAVAFVIVLVINPLIRRFYLS